MFVKTIFKNLLGEKRIAEKSVNIFLLGENRCGNMNLKEILLTPSKTFLTPSNTFLTDRV